MLQKRLQRYFPHAPSVQKKPIKHGWSATFFDLNHFLLIKKMQTDVRTTSTPLLG